MGRHWNFFHGVSALTSTPLFESKYITCLADDSRPEPRERRDLGRKLGVLLYKITYEKAVFIILNELPYENILFRIVLFRCRFLSNSWTTIRVRPFSFPPFSPDMSPGRSSGRRNKEDKQKTASSSPPAVGRSAFPLPTKRHDKGINEPLSVGLSVRPFALSLDRSPVPTASDRKGKHGWLLDRTQGIKRSHDGCVFNSKGGRNGNQSAGHCRFWRDFLVGLPSARIHMRNTRRPIGLHTLANFANCSAPHHNPSFGTLSAYYCLIPLNLELYDHDPPLVKSDPRTNACQPAAPFVRPSVRSRSARQALFLFPWPGLPLSHSSSPSPLPLSLLSLSLSPFWGQLAADASHRARSDSRQG